MIFDYVQLNSKEYDTSGQLRIKDDNEVKIIFEDMMLGNELKDLLSKGDEVSELVIKNSDETRYVTKNVSVSHVTIDGKYYHATFK
ncbi:hypothetical protein [Corticicoccus populi]|uniref:Uncharacterized protein n=1 Tax=Corticicoccus populi TaxID=1812821 RepID=A0ABW5WSE8_9STAP